MNDKSRVPARGGAWGLMSDEFDNLFEGFFRPFRGAESDEGSGLMPRIDVQQHDDHYLVHAELPGVRKEDINVSVEDGVLTINAESRASTEEKKEGRLIRQERRYGRYVRSMRLPGIDEKSVRATYRDGVLELHLPLAQEAKPRRISVDVG